MYCLLDILGRTTNLLMFSGISTIAYILSWLLKIISAIRNALLSVKSYFLLLERIIVTSAGLIFLKKKSFKNSFCESFT